MGRRYILLLIVAFATATFAQNANQRLRQLEDYLQQHSLGVEFTQKSDGDHSITYLWQAQVDSFHTLSKRYYGEALDTIRVAFASVSKDAKESYRYEYHKDGGDTIKYSVVFRNDAYEDAKFRLEHACGYYDHWLDMPYDISEEDKKPFDVAAFEAHLQPALEPLLKQQGAKSYPVYWQHDKGYEDEVGSYGNLLSGVRIRGSWPAGLTTGTYYFIPAQHEAKPIFERLDSLAYDYVNQHPEQPYAYHHMPIIVRLDNRSSVLYSDIFYQTIDIVESDDDDCNCDVNSTKYNLRCYQDEDGLHILSLTTKGILWIPKHFQKMKSWINGEATFREIEN